jgi:hypothetical protein
VLAIELALLVSCFSMSAYTSVLMLVYCNDVKADGRVQADSRKRHQKNTQSHNIGDQDAPICQVCRLSKFAAQVSGKTWGRSA